MWTDATHTYDGVIQTPEFLAAYQAEFAYRNATAMLPHVLLFILLLLRLSKREILVSGNQPDDDSPDTDEFRNLLMLSALHHKSSGGTNWMKHAMISNFTRHLLLGA